MSRVDELVDYVCDLLRADAQRVDRELYREPIKRLHVKNPEALGEKIVENLVVSARKELQNTLRSQHARVVNGFEDVDAAVKRAAARQERAELTEDADLPSDERSVDLNALTIEEIIACRLRTPRTQWLAELRDRKKVLAEQLEVLRAERDARREYVRARIAEVGGGITALETVVHKMRGDGV